MKALWIVIIIVVAAGAGWYYYTMKENGDEGSLTVSMEDTLPPNTVRVQMTKNGFSPAESRIKPGWTVEFVNSDTADHWPASGVHPTHQICPEFDPRSNITPGSVYSIQFTSPKTCPMHDHLNPSMTGKIIVEP